jgi:hypothetical protein
MSTAAIERMESAFATLRGALDMEDAGAILAATRELQGAVEAVRAHGAWRQDVALRARVEKLAPLAESGRIRINLAGDQVRQRIASLADRGVQNTPLTYRR